MERMKDDTQDLDRLFALVPAPAVPPALERRILADFERLAARGTFAAALRRLGETIWPGVPVWQPVCALALSLMIGLGVAAFAPLEPPEDDGLFAFDVAIGQGV